ncbi:MAG: DUF502 domain-containing protein [Planctomycetales bacterium]|nr:DUF502 domain-containing protein [Planctomycetales bacterium]
MVHVFSHLWRRLLSVFLAGLFAILPLVITVAIVSWVINFILQIVGSDTWIGRTLKSVGRNWVDDEVMATVVGWLLVLGAIFLLGLLVQNKTKSILVTAMNSLFQKLPLVGSLYSTAAQFVKMLNKQEKSELSGMSVVLVRFGEMHGAGLLALMPSPEKYDVGGVEHQMIYVPTSPVPMTGGLLLVPCDQIERLDLAVENLMSVYLSMGITTPQALADRMRTTA